MNIDSNVLIRVDRVIETVRQVAGTELFERKAFRDSKVLYELGRESDKPTLCYRVGYQYLGHDCYYLDPSISVMHVFLNLTGYEISDNSDPTRFIPFKPEDYAHAIAQERDKIANILGR